MADATLRSRPAAYAVIGECLRVQSTAKPRGTLARLFGISPLHPEAVSWYQGALGELEVGRELKRLGPEWTVLHAVPVGAGTSDIDHVVIGPAGVFTINTKRHKGKKVWVGGSRLLVSGQKTDHLRNARHEAKRAAKLLTTATGQPVQASALLVIVAAQGITFKERPADVTVLTLGQLVRWLNRRKAMLTEPELAEILRVAENPATWHRAPDVASLSHDVEQFHGLRREEDAALRVRRAWLAILIAGFGVFLATGGLTMIASAISSAVAPLFDSVSQSQLHSAMAVATCGANLQPTDRPAPDGRGNGCRGRECGWGSHSARHGAPFCPWRTPKHPPSTEKCATPATCRPLRVPWRGRIIALRPCPPHSAPGRPRSRTATGRPPATPSPQQHTTTTRPTPSTDSPARCGG